MSEKLNLVIITGLSGAGKTVAIQSFEDLGYFTVDNMPPNLITKFVELIAKDSGSINKLALVVDMRSRTFFDHVQEIVVNLVDDSRVNFRLLFLDASDEELVARYKETRRSHPLAQEEPTLSGIMREREILDPFKGLANYIIDTSYLSPRQLRGEIQRIFSGDQSNTYRIEVISFGFKYGIPLDADLVFDVRFLPNPYYNPELRNLTGMDRAVYDYVMDNDASKLFYIQLMNLIVPLLPAYEKEGKSVLTIAFGCTGGQHRSVAFAERVYKALKPDWHVNVFHRDKDKRKETVNRS
ncbi:RNase adapter RapZ [Lactovum miscens]|uniref:UPF0042 nucleotide-binding protein n=1 Tax=Lactovum miscens TaxID=190387 RepID=A0A841C8U5_9LACT|nr:RNase adapter RapZ [Lactovum miscens]MBB5888764.1 UPF0042 nucleotide-binding protein [Lactovum miscens]